MNVATPHTTRSTQNGFTLIETLAAILLTALVLTVAVRFYLDLSSAGNAAAKLTRDARRANAILDRIAHDLEMAYLLRKATDADPLTHPWVFLGERTGVDATASRIKFFTRHHRPRGSNVHESDLAFVAYFLDDNTKLGHNLLRWSHAQTPETLERDFPSAIADGVVVLADDLHSLAFRFLDLDGKWQEEWDSSQMTQSGQLPLAVEITLELLPPEVERSDAEVILGPYSRYVLLPVPPLNMEAVLKERLGRSGRSKAAREASKTAHKEQYTENCVTVAQCLAMHPDEPGGGLFLSGLSSEQKNTCWRDQFPNYPLRGCN